jgi:tripartite-type tricarboxylate transporter receptor subunit TctC
MLGLLSLGAVPAAAQQPSDAARYPVRAVKVIVPNGAGAALDIIGRILAQKLTVSW